MALKRRYSDEEEALALVALDFNGGNLHRKARELTIPRKTLAGSDTVRPLDPATAANLFAVEERGKTL